MNMKNATLLLFAWLLINVTYAQSRKQIEPITDLVNTIVGQQKQKSTTKKGLKAQAQAEQSYNQAMEELALKLSSDLLDVGKKRVAVANFLNTRSETTELGKFLAEEFSTLLFTRKLMVVDRGQLEVLMEENKIGAKGLLNSSEVARLGKMAGVQVIVTGTITMFDSQIKLALKGIDVEQGVMMAAAVGTIPRTESIDELYGSEAKGSGNGSGEERTFSTSQNPCKPASDCKTKSLGGVCIINRSKRDVEVHVWGQGGGKFLIHPGKSEGVNQIPITGDFVKVRLDIRGDGRQRDIQTHSIEACKVQTVTIN